MAAPSNPAEDQALSVLRVLRESSMDGYTLLSKIGLDEDTLVNTLLKLGSIVSVKGELRKEKIGEAYLSILPSVRSVVDRMLGAMLYKQGF